MSADASGGGCRVPGAAPVPAASSGAVRGGCFATVRGAATGAGQDGLGRSPRAAGAGCWRTASGAALAARAGSVRASWTPAGHRDHGDDAAPSAATVQRRAARRPLDRRAAGSAAAIVLHPGEAPLGLAFQASADDRRPRPGASAGTSVGRRGRASLQPAERRHVRRGAGERLLPGEQLEDDDAERVDVEGAGWAACPRPARGPCSRACPRPPSRSARRRSSPRPRARPKSMITARSPPARHQEDVLGLEVAVNDAGGVDRAPARRSRR